MVHHCSLYKIIHSVRDTCGDIFRNWVLEERTECQIRLHYLSFLAAIGCTDLASHMPKGIALGINDTAIILAEERAEQLSRDPVLCDLAIITYVMPADNWHVLE